MVIGGLNFKADYKVDIKRVHRGSPWSTSTGFLFFKGFRHDMGWYDLNMV